MKKFLRLAVVAALVVSTVGVLAQPTLAISENEKINQQMNQFHNA